MGHTRFEALLQDHCGWRIGPARKRPGDLMIEVSKISARDAERLEQLELLVVRPFFRGGGESLALSDGESFDSERSLICGDAQTQTTQHVCGQLAFLVAGAVLLFCKFFVHGYGEACAFGKTK